MFELIAIFTITAGIVVWIYNKLVKARNQVRAAWSDIDVQLKRRHDLIPQLVATVKTYAAYEKATLLAVTELRAQNEAAVRLPQASGLPAKAALEDAMQAGLHRLIVLAEDYPDLKADVNFRKLQVDLTETEDNIQYARRFYNGAVRILNTRIESFPALLIARPFGFVSAEFFEVEDANERSAPKVEIY
jgi:LemA protein